MYHYCSIQVDIVSPPIVVRGPLPPLQRAPHISSSSTDDKLSLSREDSLSSIPAKDMVPEISVDPDVSDMFEANVAEKESPVLKPTPDAISMTEVPFINLFLMLAQLN